MDVLVMLLPTSFFAFCAKLMATIVCARELVAFMFVAARVRFRVPSAMRASMSA